MTSWFSKLLVFGVVVAACVGATTLPASATPTEEMPPPAAQSDEWGVNGSFKLHEGIGLGVGKVTLVDASIFEIREDANHSPQIYTKFSYDRPLHGRAAFPIRDYGQDTDYWLQAGMDSKGTYGPVGGACEVFQGDPSAGGQPVTTSPFKCATMRRGPALNWEFVVEWNRDAEVSGTVAPSGPVPNGLSLTGGVYETDQYHHRYGATDLAAEGNDSITSSFHAVAIKGDTRHWDKNYDWQARMEFSYQIVDQGNPTGYYLAGMVSNYPGTVRFAANAHCEIYSTPLGDGSRLDDHTPVTDSPYTCTADGHAADGYTEPDNGHYHADFTLGRK